MGLKLGSTDINKLYLGSTEIKKAYLGSTLVFDNASTPPEITVGAITTLEYAEAVSLPWTFSGTPHTSASGTDKLFILLSWAESVNGNITSVTYFLIDRIEYRLITFTHNNIMTVC